MTRSKCPKCGKDRILTNKDLQREYRRINKAYFDDKLPRNMKVRFDNGELEAEIYGEYFDSEKEILINDGLQTVPDYAFIVLMHEMAHANVPENGHGLQFSAVLNMLWQKGAYDDLL